MSTYDACFLIEKEAEEDGLIKFWTEARVFKAQGESEVIDQSEVIEMPHGTVKGSIFREILEKREYLVTRVHAQGWRWIPENKFMTKGYFIEIGGGLIDNMIGDLNKLLENNELKLSDAVAIRDALLDFERQIVEKARGIKK